MNRRVIIFLTLALIVVGAIAAVGMASRVPSAVTKAPHVANLHPGDPAPPFQISSTAGLVDSATVGKPIFLELFATWCPHCRRAVPVLNDLYRKYGTRIQMIAVNASGIGADEQSPETQSDVVAFAQSLNVQYPVAFDPDLTIAGAYLKQGFPTVVIIDAKKKVSSVTAGEQTEAQLEKRIRAVLPSVRQPPNERLRSG
jgi:thiol-disulfide isomerase/thioredoxin